MTRRRALVLSLPIGEPTPRAALTRLTPDLALMYAGKTSKTLTRDINALVGAGLLVRHGTSVRPRVEALLAFLPVRAELDPPAGSAA